MRKHNLNAAERLAKPEANQAEQQPAQLWVQEENEDLEHQLRKFLNENAQEKIQRLIPGFDLKRLML